jgi:hypothetical protein
MTPKVFLCEPSGLTSAQRLVSDRWHERLFGLGFEVDQLRSDGYQRDPWTELMQRVRAAHGILILGFGQLFVSAGTWRRGTEQQIDLVTTWTSSWLHVEAGIALATGLPVLVARESGVREGIFASETWTGTLRGTSADSPNTSIVEEWATAVATQSASEVYAGPTTR